MPEVERINIHDAMKNAMLKLKESVINNESIIEHAEERINTYHGFIRDTINHINRLNGDIGNRIIRCYQREIHSWEDTIELAKTNIERNSYLIKAAMKNPSMSDERAEKIESMVKHQDYEMRGVMPVIVHDINEDHNNIMTHLDFVAITRSETPSKRTAKVMD